MFAFGVAYPCIKQDISFFLLFVVCEYTWAVNIFEYFFCPVFSSTFTGESGKQERFQPRLINRSIYKPLCLIVVMDIITFKFYYSAPFFPLVSMVACNSRIILQLCAVSRALSWLLPWAGCFWERRAILSLGSAPFCLCWAKLAVPSDWEQGETSFCDEKSI